MPSGRAVPRGTSRAARRRALYTIADRGPILISDTSSIDLEFDEATRSLSGSVIAGGVDHGSLAGLSDDDHSIYALNTHSFVTIGAEARFSSERVLTAGTGITLADGGAGTTATLSANLSTGISGGQSCIGGTASGNDLTLSSTSHATKGSIFFGSSEYDEANNRLGIRSNAPDDAIEMICGTLGTNERALHITATHPATTGNGATSTIQVEVTSAGSDAGIRRAMIVNLYAGYTGSSRTVGMEMGNACLGTGADVAGFNCNFGFFGSCTGTGTGSNVGAGANAEGGNENVALVGRATSDKASAVNMGLLAHARNGGASGVQIGGYFSLQANSDDTWTQSAALIADNDDQTSPIFVAMDNNTAVGGWLDGGVLCVSGTLAAQATIGVTANFQVNGTSAAGSFMSCTRWTNGAATGGANVVLASSRGATVGSTSAISSGDGMGGIVFAGDNGTSKVQSARIFGFSTGAASTLIPSAISFEVSNGTSQTEELRIRPEGLLIGGTTAPTGTATCVIQFADNGGNPTPATNSACVFAKDVAGTVEVCVTDEGGTTTQISPHAKDSPGKDVDTDIPLPIVLRHENPGVGIREWLHLSALALEVERITKKQFLFREAIDA